MIIRSNSSAVDFALLKDGKLIELSSEEQSNQFSVGDIFIAKVKKTLSGLNAAFVNVGHPKDGFLHYHDLGSKYKSLSKFIKQVKNKKTKEYELKNFDFEKEIDKNGVISEIVTPKQPILVQIIKEPISSKGPRLTSEISLAGRYMVLMPFSNKISISQKIRDPEEKKRLKNIVQEIKPKNFGVIVRTVAKKKDLKSLENDLDQLLQRWKKLCSKLEQVNHYPSKVLSEISRSFTIIRDVFDDSFNAIQIDDALLSEQIKSYFQTIAPKKKSIVKMYNDHIPIFEKFGIEKQIKSSFGKTVTMQKGAYLVIEHTEALHVIDVNSGNRSNRQKNQEDTAMEVNMIAASEIARQLRLRDMGGIIVVDFIDLNLNENRKKLFAHLQEQMRGDRAKHKILPPSRFGLIQITRQRVRPETNIKTREPSPNRNGEIEAPIVLIDKINAELSRITKKAHNKRQKVFLHLHPFIAAYILKGFPSIRLKWFFNYNKWIRIIPRDAYQYLEFRFYNKKRRRL